MRHLQALKKHITPVDHLKLIGSQRLALLVAFKNPIHCRRIWKECCWCCFQLVLSTRFWLAADLASMRNLLCPTLLELEKTRQSLNCCQLSLLLDNCHEWLHYPGWPGECEGRAPLHCEKPQRYPAAVQEIQQRVGIKISMKFLKFGKPYIYRLLYESSQPKSIRTTMKCISNPYQ